MKKCTHFHVDSLNRVQYQKNILNRQNDVPRVPPFPENFRNESENSLYFTPVSVYGRSKHSGRHKNKVILVRERRKVKCPREDEPKQKNHVDCSPVEKKCTDQRTQNIPNASKNSSCRKSKHQRQQEVLKEKCEEIGITIQENAPPTSNNIGIQTRQIQCHRKCQVNLKATVKIKQCDKNQQTQYLASHKGCQADQILKCHAQTSPFNLTMSEESDENEVSRDPAILTKEEKHLKTETKEQIRVFGHTFPFAGESPSGNLKVPHHMIAYENTNMGILIADPSAVRVHHQEWKEKNVCGSDPPKSRKHHRDCLKSHRGGTVSESAELINEYSIEQINRLKHSSRTFLQPNPSTQKLYPQEFQPVNTNKQKSDRHHRSHKSHGKPPVPPERIFTDELFPEVQTKNKTGLVKDFKFPSFNDKNPKQILEKLSLTDLISTNKKEWKWSKKDSDPPIQHYQQLRSPGTSTIDFANGVLQQLEEDVQSKYEKEHWEKDLGQKKYYEELLRSKSHQPKKPPTQHSKKKNKSQMADVDMEELLRSRDRQESETHIEPLLTSSVASYDALEFQDSGESINTEVKQNEVKAATTIQRYVKGFLTRRHVEKMRHAAKVIANALRVYRDQQKNGERNLLKSIQSTVEPSKKVISTTAYLHKGLDVKKEGILVVGGSDPTLPIETSLSGSNTGVDIFTYMINSFRWNLVGTLPEPRTHFGMARVRDELLIIGGTDPRYKNELDRNVVLKSVWKVNLKSGEWHLDPDYPKDLENPRSHFGCVVKSGIIYLFGGNNENSKALSSCEKYNPESNSWDSISPMDGPRVSMGVALYDDKIWVAGGISKDPRNPVLSSVISYDTVSDSWSFLQALPLPRAFAPLVVAHGKIYIVGGAGPRNKKSTKQVSIPEVAVFDSSTNTWREVGDLEVARHAHAAVVLDHKIVVFGGVSSDEMGPVNSLEIFDLSTSHSHEGQHFNQHISGMGVITLTP